MKTKLDKIKYKFIKNEHGEPDIYSFGVYRMGLTGDEIDDYLRVRANKYEIKNIRKKFNNIAGCNTGGMTPDGKFLMYRHDVLRFSDQLFNNTSTYFD